MSEDQKELLTKRFQTTMIGALFEFEKVFGYLWGQNKNPDFLTESEEDFRDRWDDVRNQILNNGNNQLRKCLSDLDRLNNSDNTYHYKLYNKKDKGNRYEN
jgi:hypothetical protein